MCLCVECLFVCLSLFLFVSLCVSVYILTLLSVYFSALCLFSCQAGFLCCFFAIHWYLIFQFYSLDVYLTLSNDHFHHSCFIILFQYLVVYFINSDFCNKNSDNAKRTANVTRRFILIYEISLLNCYSLSTLALSEILNTRTREQ